MYEDVFYKNIDILISLSSDILQWAIQRGIKTKINPGILNLGKIYLAQMNKHELISGFIKRSYKYWDLIYNRDEKFLMENSGVLFNELDSEYVDSFNELFSMIEPDTEEYLIRPETRASLWNILHAMIENCIKYIHEYRKPLFNEEKQKITYTVGYFPEIKVSDQIQKWNITV